MFKLIDTLSNFLVLRAAPSGAQDCSGTITVDEALQAEAARFKAQMGADGAAMNKLFGDDLVYIHSSTVQDTKKSFIESITSGNVKYRTMHQGESTVRTYGCVAIVSGAAKFDVTVKGENRTLDLLYHANGRSARPACSSFRGRRRKRRKPLSGWIVARGSW